MSEIITIHGGVVQGQDHINDTKDFVFVLDTDVENGVVALSSFIAEDKGDQTLETVARNIVRSYGLAYSDDCEHGDHEDHMICSGCGQCREDVDSTDRCMACEGKDENGLLT